MPDPVAQKKNQLLAELSALPAEIRRIVWEPNTTLARVRREIAKLLTRLDDE